jgi:uncharacterized membrane protein
MAELIAIGYDDTTTAVQAMEEVERLETELVIQADAVAAIIRNDEGKFKTVTNAHAVGAGATWGMFWGLLFGLLFFIPFLGMAFGAAFGGLMGKLEKGAIDKQFQAQVRDMLKPGTSALFMVIEKATPDKALAALSKFGGTVLKTSLSEEATAEIQKGLHGEAAAS